MATPSLHDTEWDALSHPFQPERSRWARRSREYKGDFGPASFITFNDYLISLSGLRKAARNEQLADIGASGRMSITYIGAKQPPILAL
jgi:hypothetical protein